VIHLQRQVKSPLTVLATPSQSNRNINRNTFWTRNLAVFVVAKFRTTQLYLPVGAWNLRLCKLRRWEVTSSRNAGYISAILLPVDWACLQEVTVLPCRARRYRGSIVSTSTSMSCIIFGSFKAIPTESVHNWPRRLLRFAPSNLRFMFPYQHTRIEPSKRMYTPLPPLLLPGTLLMLSEFSSPHRSVAGHDLHRIGLMKVKSLKRANNGELPQPVIPRIVSVFSTASTSLPLESGRFRRGKGDSFLLVSLRSMSASPRGRCAASALVTTGGCNDL